MATGPALFIDEPESGKISLDFPNYVKTLSTLILNSKTPYTIGIFGSWGTGKTTLMNKIAKALLREKCKCITFNAWRFSSENQHATYPLMLTIISKLLEDKTIREKFETKGSKFKRNAARVINGLKGNVGVNIPGVIQAGVSIDPSQMKKILSDEEFAFSELKKLCKPILSEGIELIEGMVDKLPTTQDNESLKLVVFVDDLDRCTPEKAAEVFESIKIFFDIQGIVFVLGLSHEIVEAAINAKYDEFKDFFDGKDYLKKIIQVPFVLPTWTPTDIADYLEDLLQNYPDYTYKEFFKSKMAMLIQGVANNPREVKRLLNNFILSNMIYKKNDKRLMEKLLFLQILAFSWRYLYEEAIHFFKDFVEVARKIRDPTQITIGGEPKYKLSEKGEDIEKKIRTDSLLFRFIQGFGDVIITASDKEIQSFRRSATIEPEIKKEPRPENQTNYLDDFEDDKNIPSIKPVLPAKQIPINKEGGIPEGGQIQSVLEELIEVYPDSNGVIQFKFISSRKQCSEFRLLLKIDDKELEPTIWIGYPGDESHLPLDTEIMTITGLSSGPHKLKLQPEGRPGGCNKGYIQRWEGTLALYQ